VATKAERAAAIRARLALLEELDELEEDEEQGVADGELMLCRELLGEFRKQQIVQDTPDPTTDAEHYALAAVLPRHLVDALLEEGWVDPCQREWETEPEPEVVAVPVKAARAKLKKVAPPIPPGLFDEIGSPADQSIAELVDREVERRLAEQVVVRVPLSADDDMPEELRVPMPRMKKPKKKKPKRVADEDVQRRYLDGTLVEPRAAREAQLDTPPPLTVEPPAAPAGWVEGPDGRLVPPPRQPVKAVYPPVRGKGRTPRAIAMGGMVSTEKWVRDGSGRKVPADQVGT
jgi:hypothetical protein